MPKIELIKPLMAFGAHIVGPAHTWKWGVQVSSALLAGRPIVKGSAPRGLAP